MRPRLEAADHEGVFIAHSNNELTIDLGEIRMNYATRGDPGLPALLLIPSQTESWSPTRGHVKRDSPTLGVYDRPHGGHSAYNAPRLTGFSKGWLSHWRRNRVNHDVDTDTTHVTPAVLPARGQRLTWSLSHERSLPALDLLLV